MSAIEAPTAEAPFAVAMALLFVFLALTITGKAMRAVADNPMLADSKGIDPDRMARLAIGIGMGLVARIDQRAAIHRVNTHQDTEKIRALRNLKHTGLTRRALRFNPHLAGAGKNLSRNQKRQSSGDDVVPWDIAPHQVIVVATVAMTEKVGVIFIKPDPFAIRQVRIPASGAFGQNPFARFLLGYNLM